MRGSVRRRGTFAIVIGIMVLSLLGVPMIQRERVESQSGESSESGETPGTVRGITGAQTFPVENYNYTVPLGAGEWDSRFSLGNYGDALDGVFDVVPYGDPIDFFICDYDSLVEWASGNTSIERYTVYEDRDFAYWTFMPPYDDVWCYVFVNNGDSGVEVWVMEYFDTNPPHVICNLGEHTSYESPLTITIDFWDIPYNVSYYSVYLYDTLLAEEMWPPTEASSSQEYSGTFTMEDLEGSTGRLEFTGYTNDTAGNGISYSFSIRIVEPVPPPTTSTTTSTSTSTTPSGTRPPPYFIIVLIGCLVAVCYAGNYASKRLSRRRG